MIVGSTIGSILESLDLGERRRVGAFSRAGDRGGLRGEVEPVLQALAGGGPVLASKRAVPIHRRQQAGHEAVAGADGVDDIDLRRDYAQPVGAETRDSAASAERRDAEPRAAASPIAERVFDRAARIQPF